MLDEVEFRPLDPSELSLVLDSWSRSFRSSDFAGVVPNHLWASTIRELVGGLIARGAQITVAAYGTRVLAWLCYEHKGEDTVLHMQYTKDPYRRQGLGRALVEYAIDHRNGAVIYTHRTRYSKYVLPKGALFAPEVARRKSL